MKLVWAVAVAVALAGAVQARADCAAQIATTQQEAEALPVSAGKTALLEQILRADNEHHEGDEAGCMEELSVAQQALANVKKR